MKKLSARIVMLILLVALATTACLAKNDGESLEDICSSLKADEEYGYIIGAFPLVHFKKQIANFSINTPILICMRHLQSELMFKIPKKRKKDMN